MPLPDGDMKWPPIDPRLAEKYCEWRAWYEGNTYELTRIYSVANQAWFGHHPISRPSQYLGGIAGMVARFFWGQPAPLHEQRTRSHVALPAEIAATSASQLFSEEISYEFEDEDQVDRTRLDEILDGNNMPSLLLEAGEIQSAMSGVYLRIVWDDTIASHPIIEVVHPDQAWPDFRFGRLQGVTFWQVVRRDGNRVWRHLERHEPGVIEHGLFQGDEQNLGTRVPLTEVSETKDIAVDANSQISTGYPGLTARYIPNIRPAKHRYLHTVGRSDFDGVESKFDELDETWSAMMKEIRLAKARLIVPQNLLETDGPGERGHFDLDRELITPLAAVAGSAADEKLALELIQPDMRVSQYLEAIQSIKVQAISSAGYSAQTFGLDQDTVLTATEVQAREKATLVTREKKTRYWANELAMFIEALTAVDQVKFPGHGGRMLRPTVVFPAAVQPSITDVATTVQALDTAGAVSIETKVRMVHPDWSDDQIEDEVAAIKDDKNLTVPDLTLPPNPDGQDAAALGMVPDPSTAPTSE